MPAPKKAHGLHAESLLTTSALRGTVALVKLKSTALGPEALPGVDAVSGRQLELLTADVVAGGPVVGLPVPVVAESSSADDGGRS